jgi:alpha-tubulin suppressor-like RCC1 family protein
LECVTIEICRKSVGYLIKKEICLHFCFVFYKMALNKTFLRLLAPSSCRCVSSFIDKKSQAEINKRKIKDKRRLSKNLTPEEVEGENIPTYTYAHTNKNPISRVYTWGLVSYGALGNPQLHVPKKKAKNPNLRATMDYPCRLSSMEMKNVRDVACGYGFSLFATSQDSRGHFYGTGINHQGQFGHHFDEKNTPLQILLQPVPVQLPGDQIKVKRLECGQAHTIALTTKGKVFSLGNNLHLGSLVDHIVQMHYFLGKILFLWLLKL